MTFQFLWFLYMYELEFYSKDEPPLLSYLFIHPLIYLYLYEPMDVYFILYIKTHSCYMDTFAQIAMPLAIENPMQAGFCVPLLCPVPLQGISFSYCESCASQLLCPVAMLYPITGHFFNSSGQEMLHAHLCSLCPCLGFGHFSLAPQFPYYFNC